MRSHTYKVFKLSDITMCSGKGCGAKETCYRYIAKPSIRQSYFMKPPFTDEGCEYYWNKK